MRTHRLPRTGLRATLLFVLVLAGLPAATAQTFVRYGDPVVSGGIDSAGETDRYLLLGARQGDTLRVTFRSANSGYPYYTAHRLDVWDGTSPVGNPVVSAGVVTVTLPRDAVYTITVRAENNQFTGWYRFQVDRLNDPVGAHRIAFDWNMKGSIAESGGCAVYTVRGQAGGTARLRMAAANSGYPYYTTHYAEIVDRAGQRLASVKGNGFSESFDFPSTDVYTVFVAAEDYAFTGWYAVAVECLSYPGVPCDCEANAFHYGAGSPGTHGIPSLTAQAFPRRGTATAIAVGNSSGVATLGVLLIGGPDNLATTWDGTLLVQPSVVLPLSLDASQGATVPLPIPDDPLLCGFGVACQTLVADPGATHELAFSRALGLIVGN